MPSVETLRLVAHGLFTPYVGVMAATCDDEKLMTRFVRESKYLPFVLAYLAGDLLLVAASSRSAAYKGTMLLHHLLLGSATAYVHFFAPHLLPAYAYASLCEISALLLDVHEVLNRLGAGRETMMLNGVVLFAAHVATRLVVHPWLTYDTVPRVSQSGTERAAVTCGMSALICLNVYWTWGFVQKGRRIAARE